MTATKTIADVEETIARTEAEEALATSADYTEVVGDLVRGLRAMAEAVDRRLVAFDDDGHFRHMDDAAGITDRVLRSIQHLGLSRLMEAAAAADGAIDRARQKALDSESER